MRSLLVVLYTALALGANAALASPAAEALREGDMRKLAFHEEPQPVPDAALVDLADAPRSLAEWRGQWAVVNFWATWCAPCRHEMPALDRLAGMMADEGLAVVTIATGRNPVPGIERFFDEIGMQNLPALRDPKSELARRLLREGGSSSTRSPSCHVMDRRLQKRSGKRYTNKSAGSSGAAPARR